MKNSNLDINCLEVFFVKSELASVRLSFLPKMGLEFFSDGLEFFRKHTKKAWTTISSIGTQQENPANIEAKNDESTLFASSDSFGVLTSDCFGEHTLGITAIFEPFVAALLYR